MVRALRIAAAVIVVLGTHGCAHGIELRSTPLALSPASTYVTFFVLPGSPSGNADIDREFNAEIEAALADKGLVETSPEEAEAVVVVHTATPTRRSRDAFYQGWGGWAWRVPDTRSTAHNEEFAVGSVVVDIFDAWTKKLVWHGFAPHAVSTESKDESVHAIKRAVATIFAEFPSADGDASARIAGGKRSPATPGTSMDIIFSPRPALLAEIDGEPTYEEVEGTGLQRIVNANALIIRDESGMHYLRVAGRWLEAYDAIGPWSFAGTVPEGADVALHEAHQQRSDGPGAISAHDSTPVVFVTTRPAALIVTDGEPEYVLVDGTSLLRIRNTSVSVFKEPTDQELYVQLPRGWFRAWTTNGPWQPFSEADLPADLAQMSRSAASLPGKAI
jgi:hypothetical protein